jgi:ribonucleoside-diphosphate reductase alpha chain
MVNEIGRGVMGGGSRRAAMWAGLPWDHDDIQSLIRAKDWSPEIQARKAESVDYPAPLDMTNVSVMLNSRFFTEYTARATKALSTFEAALRLACRTGEPGFSVSLIGEDLRNTCGEITSDDDSDACCLGSLNIARMGSVEEFRSAVEVATAFLLAGTEYTFHPYDEVRVVQSKNRRLGLGLMGLHEWLLTHGLPYAAAHELKPYLQAYTDSEAFAKIWADSWNMPTPVRTRAIAPTGSISILAETTSGIEPLYCASYMRRYRVGGRVAAQYVLDPVAERLVKGGVRPESIEDSSSLARDLEKRLRFQAWIQEYVDQAIAVTINIPSWGSTYNNEDTLGQMEETIVRYLPALRGLTLYPDGARSGQPLTPVPWHVACERRGKEFQEEWANICSITGRGTCGE